MLEKVLDQRLNQHFRDQHLQSRLIHIVTEVELILKSFLLQLRVILNMIELRSQGDRLVRIVHAVSHHPGKSGDQE